MHRLNSAAVNTNDTGTYIQTSRMISFFLQMLKEIMYTFTYKHCKRSSGKCAIEN